MLAKISDTPFDQKFFDLRKWVFRNGADKQTDTQVDNADSRLNPPWDKLKANTHYCLEIYDDVCSDLFCRKRQILF